MRLLHGHGRSVSFTLLLKSTVGFSIAALALFGGTGPLVGVETTVTSEFAAAIFGALLGVVLALRG